MSTRAHSLMAGLGGLWIRQLTAIAVRHAGEQTPTAP
jgi:hypothetical protein